MQRLDVSGAVRPVYGSLGVKRLRGKNFSAPQYFRNLCGAHQASVSNGNRKLSV